MQTMSPTLHLTDQRLAELGVRIDTEGFAANEAAVAELVADAHRSGLDLPAADVLGDRTASEVIRSRALATLAGDWPEVRRVLQDRFDESFQELLKAWTAHEDLRKAEAPIADLSASRSRLDNLRRLATSARS